MLLSTCLRSIAIAAWLLLQSHSLYGQLTFDPPTIDLGDVKAGQVFAHQVKVTNTSNAPIAVQELKTSCGCIRPVLEPMTLTPGASGVLKLDINTLVSNAGPAAFGVKLRYPENGQLKEQQFIITCRVHQELVITPTAITCYGEKPRPQTITILDKRATPLKPIKLERTSPYLEVEWLPPPQADPQPQYALKVSVREDLPTGKHDHEVVIHTDDPAYPVLRVPITIVKKAKARFVVSPYLVQLSPNITASRVVTIRDQHGLGVTIERCEVSAGISVSPASQAAASVSINVALDKTREAPFDGEVRVYVQGQVEPVKILVSVE